VRFLEFISGKRNGPANGMIPPFGVSIMRRPNRPGGPAAARSQEDS